MRRRDFCVDTCKAACLVAFAAHHTACGGNPAEPLTPVAPSPSPGPSPVSPLPTPQPAPPPLPSPEPSPSPTPPPPEPPATPAPPRGSEVVLVPLVPVSVGQGTAVVTVGPDSPLARPWGVARVSFERDSNPWDFLLVRAGEQTVTALSAVCTHQGCLVVLMTEQPVFVCPCHGSRYDHAGAVVRGPANERLRPFPAQYVGGVLTITFQA